MRPTTQPHQRCHHPARRDPHRRDHHGDLHQPAGSAGYGGEHSNQEETINVHGRITPIRVVNGKDLTAMIRTLGGSA
ncbi:hypothetical protein [Deinococcus aquaticus]|uniref:Uncharacterized protein n=1 Tax=Deinococcus aquaticus TaxID=328692 RepID=A0ABY7UYH0_9DEIO|nr:hypothetical protein [Deinococcus aquaticus]WDA57963.1 hypothetical protein M8445_11450 [Deinococcus aquaticus]